MDYSKLIKELRENNSFPSRACRTIGVSFASVNRWEMEHHESTIKSKRKIVALCKKHKIKSMNIQIRGNEYDNRRTPETDKHKRPGKANLIWDIATALYGEYKPHEYGRVILPMTVIKRFDDTLKDTKQAVVKIAEELDKKGVTGFARDGILKQTAKHAFTIQANSTLRNLRPILTTSRIIS